MKEITHATKCRNVAVLIYLRWSKEETHVTVTTHKYSISRYFGKFLIIPVRSIKKWQ